MRWERDTSKYACGEILFLGKWQVGGFHYDSSRSKDDEKKWKATSRLPGIKENLGHFVKDEQAREAAEKAVKHWLAGLPDKPELQ